MLVSSTILKQTRKACFSWITVSIHRGQSFGVACNSVTVIVGVILQKVAESHQARYTRHFVRATIIVLHTRNVSYNKTADLAHHARFCPFFQSLGRSTIVALTARKT